MMEPMSRIILAKGFRPAYYLRASQCLKKSTERRHIHIQAIPSGQPTTINGSYLSTSSTPRSTVSPDAKFEVLGSPSSFLSAKLSASQNLYTRRGTLVGLSGKAENVVSTLRILEPLRRATLGIPFLYQKISSTSPVTALISVRSPVTSFALLQLDGTVDWMVTQRRALLAWTGHSLNIKPTLNRQLSLIHWGNSEVTGRGLLALVGIGQIYSIDLKAGEQYIAHPSNVVAYTMTNQPPQPYRFKSTTIRFQIPSLGLGKRLSNSNFVKNLSDSDTWKATIRIMHTLKTWTRRTIWGDRLFLQFQGPTTILVQSRASRVNDVLTDKQVNEIADSPPGAVKAAVDRATPPSEEDSAPQKTDSENVHQSVASVRRDGKVEFQQAGGSQRS